MIKKIGIWLLKTFTRTVISFFIFFIFSLVIISAFLSSGKSKTPIINKGSYIKVAFPSPIIESGSDSITLKPNNSITAVQYYNIVHALDYAAQDPRIDGLLLLLDSWFISAEHTDEISTLLKKCRDSGKTILAYGTTLTKRSYLPALTADIISMPPTSSARLILTGYHVSVPYVKNLADKAGINFTVLNTGSHKTAYENLKQNTMSPAYKQDISRILSASDTHFISELAVSRQIPETSVKKMLYSGKLAMLSPEKAKELDLIDEIQYFSDIIEPSSENKKKLEVISLRSYIQAVPKKSSPSQIAVIHAEGEIRNSFADSTVFDNNPGITTDKITKLLKKCEKDNNIKAVILRLNSPGGSPLASDIIYNEIKNLNSEKPVIVSMGPVAASGGYYIACGAEKIFAGRRTITGSIGVVSLLPNISTLSDKIGISFQTVKKGTYSDIMNIAKPVSENEKTLMQSVINDIYTEFKLIVSEHRELQPAEVDKAAQGKIWTGAEAIQNGLADTNGNLLDAIRYAAEITDLRDYSVIVYPKQKTFIQKISALTGNAITYSSEKTGILNPDPRHKLLLSLLKKYTKQPIVLIKTFYNGLE
jgi:protease-4